MRTKILFLINTLRDGGAEKILTDIVNHLDSKKYDIEVRLICKKGEYLDKLNSNIHLSYIISQLGTLWARLVSRMLPRLSSEILHTLFIRKRYDIEVAFLEGYATKIIAGAPKGTKTIAWVHCDVVKTEWINGVYSNDNKFAKCYRKIDQVVCVSESVKEAFISRWGNTGNLIVRYNPVDTEKIIYKSKERIPIEPSSNRLVLISLGRFTYPKNFLRLLRAVDHLKNDYSFELWLLGDGEEREQLQSYVEQHNLSDVVFMPGFIKNPYPYIAKSDLYVCSSIYEGFSTATTEALVLGIPILTTDVSGAREMLGNNEFGIITENSDNSFEKGLLQYLSQQELLKHYKKAAQERGHFFEFSVRMNDIESLFRC